MSRFHHQPGHRGGQPMRAVAMTSTYGSDRPQPERDDLEPRGSGAPAEFLAPVIAGAFARGIAETFALLGTPALLIDRGGLVLNANLPARPFLERGLTLRAGRLLAQADRDDAALAAFMAAVIREPHLRRSIGLSACGLTLSSLPAPGGPATADQLLHAIIVIGAGSAA